MFLAGIFFRLIFRTWLMTKFILWELDWATAIDNLSVKNKKSCWNWTEKGKKKKKSNTKLEVAEVQSNVRMSPHKASVFVKVYLTYLYKQLCLFFSEICTSLTFFSAKESHFASASTYLPKYWNKNIIKISTNSYNFGWFGYQYRYCIHCFEWALKNSPNRKKKNKELLMPDDFQCLSGNSSKY